MTWLIFYFLIITYSYVGLWFHSNLNFRARNIFFLLSSFFSFGFIFLLNFNRIIVKDSINYTEYFNFIGRFTFFDLFLIHDEYMFGFRFWTWFNTIFHSNEHLYFAFTALFMLFLVFIALSINFGSRTALLFTTIYSMYPWFSLYSSSGIRQGFALALLLISISFLINDKPKRAFFFFITSISFHVTSLICFVIFIVRRLSIRFLLFIYSVCVFLSIVGFFEFVVSYIIGGEELSSRNAIYLNSDRTAYQTGFRFDFFVFSILPILYYYYACFFTKNSLTYKTLYLLKIYIVLNIYMHTFNFIPYYDRVAAYSWFLWPMLILSISLDLNKRYFLMSTLFLLTMSFLAFRFYNWGWYFHGF